MRISVVVGFLKSVVDFSFFFFFLVRNIFFFFFNNNKVENCWSFRGFDLYIYIYISLD